MTNKKALWLTGAAALIGGYLLGSFIGFPPTDDNLTSGDIKKTNIYSNQEEDPDLALLVEQLQTDTTLLNQTKGALGLLQFQVDTLNELTSRTLKACDGIEEFAGLMDQVKSLKVKTSNTGKSLAEASEVLGKIEKGENVGAEYEQASNNAFIGFAKVENGIDVSKALVAAAMKYAERVGDKASEEVKQIANDWAEFSALDAAISGDEETLKYWQDEFGGSKVGELGDGFRLITNLDVPGSVELTKLDNKIITFKAIQLMSKIRITDLGYFQRKGGTGGGNEGGEGGSGAPEGMFKVNLAKKAFPTNMDIRSNSTNASIEGKAQQSGVKRAKVR